MKKLLVGLLLVLTSLFIPAYSSQKAINFSFTDIHHKSIHLSAYKGKWVLVNFWAPWCPRCWGEFSLLNDLNSRKDFVVIGIAMDYAGDTSSVLTMVSRYNLDYPQVLGGDRHDTGPNSPAMQIGPVDFYPMSYLYDPSGELIMFIPGMISKEKILTFINNYRR